MGYLQDILTVLEETRDVEVLGQDFFIDVSRGKHAGISGIIIRGHNPNQTSASGFVDIAESGDLTYLTVAETMNLVSTSVADDAGGTGLLNVLIKGIKQNGEEQQEVLQLNGTANVLTKLAYLRVNFLIALGPVGTAGWNVGNITATASSAATIQCEMDATESLSQNSHYTVPVHHSIFPLRVELNCAKQTAGTAPVVEFKVYARLGGPPNPWLQFFDKKLDAGDNNELDVEPTFAVELPARTDLRARADTDQNSTETRTRIYFLLIHLEDAA